MPPLSCAAALPITWQPPDYRGHMNQLSAEDRVIWLRFLARFADHYDGFAYDVPVGGLDCDQDDVSDELKRAWRYCTAKRIDVVGLRLGRPTIFEIRYQAGVSALGALLTYHYLFRTHNPTILDIPLRLITDHIASDTREAAEHYHIQVTELPE